MNKTQKKEQVNEIEEKLQRAKATVFSDFCGMKVQDMERLRQQLREAKIEYKVFKNTLIRLGVEGRYEVDDFLKNPTALAFGYDDPTIPAKALVNFAKDNPALKIKGGIIEGKVLNVKAINALAELPSKEILIAMLVTGVQSPLRGLMNVLNGSLTKLVMVLKAIEEKKKS